MVELQKQQNIHIPDGFNLDFIPHYCILGKNLKTGKVFPYTLKDGKVLVKGCTYFSEQECANVYRSIRRMMYENQNLKLVIFNTAAMDGEQKFWKPNAV